MLGLINPYDRIVGIAYTGSSSVFRTTQGTLGEKKRRLAARDAGNERRGAADASARAARAARELAAADQLQAAGRLEAAVERLEAACRIAPAAAAAWDRLGVLEQALGNVAKAEDAYRRALDLAPSPVRRLKLATLISPIMPSREAIAAERERMRRIVDALLAEKVSAHEDPLREALWTNFYLAYHGLDDRELQTCSATLYRRLFPSLDCVAAQCRAATRRNGRPRIGLVSQFFCNHSIGRTSRGLFAQLPRDELEIVAIFLAPSIDDDYSRFIRRHAERSVDIPRDLSAARSAIGALELDVLFYQDIGMDPFSYFLAFARLAPLQCVSYGHPDTTGIATIDDFISNDLYELPGAHAHYSERLVTLHDLGTLAYYYRPEPPPRPKRRADFGLADSDHLYICPQNLFKFHPDMDDLIAGILRRDPRGRLVAVEGKIANWTTLLRRRWASAFPDVLDRVTFVPRMPSVDYVNLIALADVMLDTRHFNGMNTSLEALSQGTPVVTWPADFQRGRHTQAMYRKMALPELIAASADAYIETIVRLGTDPSYRSAVSSTILERNAVLFQDASVVDQLGRYLHDAARRPS